MMIFDRFVFDNKTSPDGQKKPQLTYELCHLNNNNFKPNSK